MVVTCCGCMMRIPPLEKLSQKISTDNEITDRIQELKATEEYSKVVEIAGILNETNKKSKFNTDDIKKAESAHGLYQEYATSLKEKYTKYWDVHQFSSRQWNKLDDVLGYHKGETPLNASMFNLTTKASFFTYEYCRPYRCCHSETLDGQDKERQVFDVCNSTLEALFYSKLFKDVDYDAESIRKKEQNYNNVSFEKRTGCKADKAKSFAGRFYEVFQQTTDGTLVRLRPNSYEMRYSGYPKMFLITKNKQDSALVDGENIHGGTFQDMGNYKYVTVTGTIKTIKKYKRCE